VKNGDSLEYTTVFKGGENHVDSKDVTIHLYIALLDNVVVNLSQAWKWTLIDDDEI